jgi:hypothetical protein
VYNKAHYTLRTTFTAVLKRINGGEKETMMNKYIVVSESGIRQCKQNTNNTLLIIKSCALLFRYLLYSYCLSLEHKIGYVYTFCKGILRDFAHLISISRHLIQTRNFQSRMTGKYGSLGLFKKTHFYGNCSKAAYTIKLINSIHPMALQPKSGLGLLC